MAGRTPENPSAKEPRKEYREVKLGQEFTLFTSQMHYLHREIGRVNDRYDSDGWGSPILSMLPIVRDAIVLNDSYLSSRVPFMAVAECQSSGLEGGYAASVKYTSITPLNPGAGYDITQEDFRVESRREKHARLGEYLMQRIPGRYSYLSVNAVTFERLKKIRALDYMKNCFEETITEEELEKLSRLRLQLTFASEGGVVGSTFYGDPKSNKNIRFYDFYPVETGPLPTTDEQYPTPEVKIDEKTSFVLYPTFRLEVQPDRSSLSKITGTFFKV